ncbi:MAG: hypothetical protein ABI702_06975 [Burkholderiales bacterium]
MRAVSTLTAIGTALWFAATSVHAVGFGKVTNATQLGQPLNFAAALRLEPDESLARECVSAEVQSGENKLQSGQIRTTLEGDTGDRSVRVSTMTLIDEPVVTVSVTVGCEAKITRRFVVFVDPPLINLAQAGAAPNTLPPQRNDSQVAPIVTIVQGENAASAPPRAPAARQRARPSPLAPRVVPAPNAGDRPAVPVARSAPPRRPLPGPQPAKTAPNPGGSRLKLESAPSAMARAASEAASSPIVIAAVALANAEAASASARAKEQADQVAKERERIQALEEGLNKLRADSQATQQSLANVQSRLKQAETERYANPLVYGLAWLSALLALAVAGLMWRQSRGRSPGQWWTAPGAAAAGDARAAGRASVAGTLASAPQPLDDPVTGAGAFNIPTVVEDDEPPLTQAPVGQAPPPFTIGPLTPAGAAAEPARELSVEELIDLEQQAEFFIVLGQDEAAIELLMSHVRSDGGISPLPYLKLLEIYRRRGENEAYERIRDRFNRRFNAYAPDWEADLQHGRSLVDYPATIVQLQGLWATPSRVMETLDASLFRRNKSDETFDLPAYRELLFLYSIARDLAEHGGAAPAGDVDLLLPLNGDPDAEPIARLSASAAEPDDFRAGNMMTMPLDLDVSLDAVPPPGAAVEPGFIDFDLNEPLPSDKPGDPKP